MSGNLRPLVAYPNIAGGDPAGDDVWKQAA